MNSSAISSTTGLSSSAEPAAGWLELPELGLDPTPVAGSLHSGQPFVVDCRCAAAPAGRAVDPDEALLGWIRPMVTAATAQLRSRLHERGIALPDRHAILAPDRETLLAMVKRPLVAELAAAAARSTLCGANPSARFDCFAAALTDPAVASALHATYPVLARELAASLSRWVDVRFEFAERLRADLAGLADRFGVYAPDVTAVSAVRFDAGDRHRRGRSVAVVTLPGATVVYKPRALSLDEHFAALVDVLNRVGLEPALRPVTTWDRGDYGWSAYVLAAPCLTAAAVTRFYQRQGALLALCYLLRAFDMHRYNVIAAGEHPALIDLETTFHAPAAYEDGGGVVGQRLRESVLAVLLLPQREIVVDADDVRGVEISGLAGSAPPGQMGLHAAIGYADEGTDRMRVVRRPDPLQPSHNRPFRPSRTEPEPVDVAAVIDGFTTAYRLLLAHRTAVADALTAFAGDHVRVVLRDTRDYRAVLREAWHPDLLRDLSTWDSLADVLVKRGPLADLPTVVASERAQLADHDIPLFEAPVRGTALNDPAGQVVADVAAHSGWDAVTARLHQLSEVDLAEQLWYVRASLATLEPPQRRHSSAGRNRARPGAAIEPAAAIEAAGIIADRLVSTALRAGPDDGPEWVGLNLLGGRFWTIGPTSLGLATGVTGIALFLAEHAALTGSARSRQVAADVWHGLVREAPEPDDLTGMSIGGFEDLGSVVYLLARLRSLWRDEVGLDSVAWLIPAVTDALATGECGLSVHDGAAGAVLALLALRRAAADELTPLIDPALSALGERLLGAVDGLPGIGLAGGASGAALALSQLHRLNGRAGYLEAARTLLDGEAARLTTDSPPGWDGLAGSVLARSVIAASGAIAVATGGPESVVAQGIRPLLDRLRRVDDSGDDSLGFGNLARAEALVAAGEGELAGRVAAGVADRVRLGAADTAAPMGVWTPGLLPGAAGLGYGLLRAAAPDQVPNILTLAADGGSP
ncbi:MAG: type 2 lanthipeptide synthetase LanM family protein [Micromonosporaceae bacterium]